MSASIPCNLISVSVFIDKTYEINRIDDFHCLEGSNFFNELVIGGDEIIRLTFNRASHMQCVFGTESDFDQCMGGGE